MRIRHLLDTSGFGGIESHVAQLLPALAERGHDVALWRFQDHGPHTLADHLAASGLGFRVLNGRWSGVLGALRDETPDVLHTHGYKAGIVGRLCGLWCGIPVVSTFHNGDRGTGKLRIYTSLDRYTALFSRNIAVSAEIASGLNKVTTIPNFVDVPADQTIRSGSDTIGFVGRLDHVKGPDRFVELARSTGLPAVMFGDGAMRTSLENSAPKNLHFAGFVPSMRDHWQRMGLLVISSRAEGLPLAALEAMAAGVPVATLGLGALPELIDDGQNGFLAGADDMDTLIKKVCSWKSMSSEARMAMACKARETILAAYSREKIVPQIEELYLQSATRFRCNSPRYAKLSNNH